MKRDSTCMEGERGRAFVRAVPPEAARARGRPVPAPSACGARTAGCGTARDRGEKEPCGLSPFAAFSRLLGRGGRAA